MTKLRTSGQLRHRSVASLKLEMHLEQNKARMVKDQRFSGTSNQLHCRKGGLHPYL